MSYRETSHRVSIIFYFLVAQQTHTHTHTHTLTHTNPTYFTPHIHTLFFPFFQRHTSLLYDSVISLTITNGLLTFPKGEHSKLCLSTPSRGDTVPSKYRLSTWCPVFLLFYHNPISIYGNIVCCWQKEKNWKKLICHFFLKRKNGLSVQEGIY